MTQPVAIVGLGCVLPDAPDVESFWRNLTEGKNSIREVSPERWDPTRYWAPEKTPDKTYAKIGAFVSNDAFNGLEYRMPPKMVEQVDKAQQWALAATRQAFQDAGYATGIKGDEGRTFDRDRCAVIIGNAMGGETNKIATKRLFWPDARAALEEDNDFQQLPAATQAAILERAEARYKSTTVPVTEDTMPGHLSNVFAGRIANVFDLGGKNFTTDAACASSLAALDAALDTLENGDADMVVWGGADRSMDVTPYVQFSAIGALSPDGSRPFDAGANGFVMGEGCAMFILKRLADAQRDGDTIYAVVRGIGASSDGKGKGITAPNPKGQEKAVVRAYQDAGVDPFTIGYLEAHGTSTPVGDPVELTSVENAFKTVSNAAVEVGAIRVGSVKSNIGHLKAAAGAAGALKAALAIHRGFIPPSINVQTLNPRIDWANSPFQVATQGQPWTQSPRRAAISSFGFGGTNFHVVLEQYVPGTHEEPPMTHAHPPAVVFDGDHVPEALQQIQTQGEAAYGAITAAGITAQRRVGIAPQTPSDVQAKLALAEKAASNPAAAKLAFQQGVFLNQGKPKGKVAFLFPGQGTQYVNMGRDLAAEYPVVRETFAEADAALMDEIGVKLTDILWPEPNTPEAQKASNEKLKLTEFTQPAVLAMDVAILRLLNQWGMKPDMVAGHSLGEYGALVAAGVMPFTDALHAVAARGREMANVDLPDLGKMASVPANWETVQAAIETVDEYVICANKNCPSQTVIAGSSAGVDAAVAKLTSQGLQCIPLPVSAAFHSDIVAPASEPLRRVLGRLDVQAPKVRVLSNVGAQPYPDDPDAIRDNLAVQVASAVEWIGIMERMWDEGVRTFIEVGPKKALTGFAMDIFKDRMGPEGAVAICSNHPKKGEMQHINELFAFFGAWGYQPAWETTPAPPTAPSAVSSAPQSTGNMEDIMRRLNALEAKLGANALAAAPEAPTATPEPTPAAMTVGTTSTAANDDFGFFTGDVTITGASVGLPGDKPLFAEDNFERILRGDNLISTLPETERAKIADKNIVRLVKGGDGNARFEIIDDVAQVIQLAGRRGDFDITEWGVDAEFASVLDRTFQYAIAAGLEALREAGIPLQRTYVQTSTGSYLPKQWKLPEPLQRETGIIFASAFPGYDNLLRDVSQYLADKYAGRTLDELQQLYQELLGAIDSPELKERMSDWFEDEFERLQSVLPDHGAARYEFNRKFLFNVLSMGHAQFAQFIGAKGPNTQVNAACASTTQAIAMAEDWIRMGRCKRVLVVGADDVTSDAMFEWVGAGFLASGAATTKGDVAEAALPFDARRHGMIVGMGAVGMVIEAAPEVEARGMRPMARLLSTQVANSAFHGSRLDIEDIAWHMQQLVARAGRYGVRPGTIAANTVFVSHETYTPARGGSASAEIHALRATFGDHADKVVIANTKGFTGHPQGAGIEDAISLKMLQRGTVPPIANFRDADPELGNLNLSKGGAYDVRYALRLAAGFGSQIAMTLTELVAREDERMADQAAYDAWLAQVSGQTGPALEVVHRTLRLVDQGAPERAVAAAEAIETAAPTPSGDALATVTGVIAEKTGYPMEMLEPDLDMEADLGIDTVKQAELFGELREHFGVPLDETLQLKDYNTLRKIADYMGGATSEPTPSDPAPTPHVKAPATDAGDALDKVTAVIAEKTGYPVEMLEPDLDMEADLGIDTVKQAELFGELREHFGVPLDESLQLSNYNTLRKVADYMGASEVAVAPSAPKQTTITEPTESVKEAPAPAPQVASPKQTTLAGNVAALDKVTEVIAEKTGYPIEMLEPDLDMEADLGIDTVKQAELFGELREHFGVPLDESLQLSDYNTLRKVADYMGGSTEETEPVEAEPEPPTQEVAPAEVPVTRQPTLEAVAPSTESGDALDKVTEVIAEKTGYPVDMLEPDLDMEADLGIDTVKQAELFGELREHFGVPLDESLQLSDYNTLRKVADYMGGTKPAAAPTPQAEVVVARPTLGTSIVRRVPVTREEALTHANNLPSGNVLIVGAEDGVPLSALAQHGWMPGPDPIGIIAIDVKPHDGGCVHAMFQAAKAHPNVRFVLVATKQDGAHGLELPRDADMAGLAGLGKALKKELPEALVKVVDLDPDLPLAMAVDELANGGPRTEVCYDAEGVRHVVDVVPEPLEGTPDVADTTWVVSGGAQGITVELLAALAPQGPRLILLGRTKVPTEAETWATWGDAQWKADEQATMAAMKAAGDKVTPVSLKKALAPKQKAAEVHRNLQRLTDLGAEVMYIPVDVTDEAAVTNAIRQAREHFGSIDGVIHAAGVEISKDLASKDQAQFDLVYDIKTKGFEALMTAIPEPLQWIVGFGSVAGRFGNIGQTDYSAANEWLAKAIKVESERHDAATAFTVAWGPWGEVGMATQGSILQIMEATGVTPIPTAEGIKHFLAELATEGVRESIVAGALGAIDADGQIHDEPAADRPTDAPAKTEPTKPDAPAQAPETQDASHEVPAAFRLLRAVESMDEGHIVATLTMDRGVDPYAEDHAIDGTPYLPGVFGLEAFAEAATLLTGEPISGAKDVRFSIPLKQLKDRAAVGRVEVTQNGDTLACRLTSRMVGPDGVERGDPRTHFEATLVLGEPTSATGQVPACNDARTRDQIYPPFFHGPSFQVLRAAGPTGIATAALPYAAAFDAGEMTPIVHPLVAEAMFQVCGLAAMETDDAMCLPAAIETLTIRGAPTGTFRVWCKPTGLRDGLRTYNVTAADESGTVLLEMQGFAMVEIGPAPPMVSMEPAPPAEESTPIPLLDLALPEVDGLSFAAVGTHAIDGPWFTDAELATAADFKADKRREEWLAGRLAAKAVALHWDDGLEATEVTVVNEEGGRPVLHVHGEPVDAHLSLTHRDGMAIAVLGLEPMGVDLEVVEPREPSFAEQAFNETERPLAEDPMGATCLWAAKEATFKRIGTGLRQALHAWTVTPDGIGGANCEGPEGNFGIRFFDVEGRVLALTTPAFDLTVDA